MGFKALYLSLACLTLFSISKAAIVDFDKYTTEDGLSNAYVTSIIKDSDGYMWFGSRNGLNRFDGITFSHYFNSDTNLNTLSGNFITCIDEDKYGNLWVGTMNGLCLYNKEYDNFIRIRINIDSTIYKDTYISKIFIDSKDFVWITTFFGIFRFKVSGYFNESNIGSIKYDLHTIYEDDVKSSFKHHFTSIQEDQSGKVWFTTYSKKLYYFDYEENAILDYTFNFKDAEKFSNRPKTLLICNDSNFYLSVFDCGVFFINQQGDVTKLNGENSPQGVMIASIIEDRTGNFWFGDQNEEGISLLRKNNNRFEYFQPEHSNPNSLLIGKINTIYEDNTGNIWIGSIIGLNKYTPGKIKFKSYFWQYDVANGLSFNNILCFEESKSGDIWIGTDGGGLNKLNRATGAFEHFKYDPDNPESISSNSIISMCEDSFGALWLGTFNGGLAKYENGKFTSYKPIEGDPYSISNLHIWYVLEDSKQNLWVATLNSGLHLYDRTKNRFYSYVHEYNDTSSLVNVGLIQLFEDSKQNLYIITYLGVSTVNINDIDFSETPPELFFRNLQNSPDKNSISKDVRCVNEDMNGNIWFGTIGNGIDKYDPETGIFTNFNTKDGLPGNSVSSIQVDNFNNLWLGTDKGLTKFNPTTKQIIIYDKTDGLQNIDIKGWSLKTKDGQMFFGGLNGFNSFYPDEVLMSKNLNLPPVVLTGMKIFNSHLRVGDEIHGRIIIDKNISIIEDIELKHNENFISISFAALDYTAPEKNQYKYKMEGLNNEWINAGNSNEVVYTNLDPGQYTFRVIASNNEGLWNEEGSSIRIEILPPWWERIWFKITAGLFITSLIVFFAYSRFAQLKSQKKRLEIVVKNKTSELLSKNNLLQERSNELFEANLLLEQKQIDLEERQEEIQTQNEELMEQKLSLEMLNEELKLSNATKDKFFSIIAHDVRSPFGAILGFSKILLENYNEMSYKKRIETIKILVESSENIFELLENLLNWSRTQRGVIPFNPEYINCDDVIEKIFKLLDALSQSKNINIVFQNTDIKATVYADKSMFEAILRNLIVNAIKFTSQNGRIYIKKEVNIDSVIISVEDNGVGISPNRLKKLFRIDSNQSTLGTNKEKGTGLGLILVNDFVRINGGNIWVESEIGKGSLFKFSLPREPVL